MKAGATCKLSVIKARVMGAIEATRLDFSKWDAVDRGRIRPKTDHVSMCAGVFILRFVYKVTRKTYRSKKKPRTHGIVSVVRYLGLDRRTIRRHLLWSLGFTNRGTSSDMRWDYDACNLIKAKRKGVYFGLADL